MTIYTLKFVVNEPGLPDIVDFEAADRMSALVLGHEKAACRSAQLWDAEQLLCTIRRGAPARDIALGKTADRTGAPEMNILQM
jgi:hypothetical protein